MPPLKEFNRKCEICHRTNFSSRMLGPMVHTKTISAHFNCVVFSPITPDKTSLAPNPEDDAIGGVTTRFIRDEGRRAKKLVCNYCKTTGAHIGCCKDIGNDVAVFCPKKFHVDCGLKAGASFNICKNRGTVSICFEHRDEIERMMEGPNLSTLNRDNDSSDNTLSSDGEYDVGHLSKPDAFETIEMGTVTTSDTVDAEIVQDPLVEEAADHSNSEIDGDKGDGEIELLDIQNPLDERDAGQSLFEIDGHGETEFLDIQNQLDIGATGESNSEIDGDGGDSNVDIQSVEKSSTSVKDEPFNLAMMRTSLDNSNNSDASDCIITTAYYLYDDVDDNNAK